MILGAQFNPLKKVTSKSGGLFYHYLALKYKNSLWSCYKKNLNKLIIDLKFPTEKIILVGPSGGYALDADWVNQFSEVLVAEPDGLALKILSKKIKDFKAIESPVSLDILNCKKFSKHAKTHTFIFCNLLGQLYTIYHDLGGDESSFEQWKELLALKLSEINFVSFHDVFSITSKNNLDSGMLTEAKTVSDCLQMIKLNNLGNKMLQLTDHRTEGLFPEARPAKYLFWQMTPQNYHIMEFTHNLSH